MATPCEDKLDTLSAKIDELKSVLQQILTIIGG